MWFKFIVVILLFNFVGCSPLEISKSIWGSSTRALEVARNNAIVKTYDKSYWELLRSALNVIDKKEWVVFKKDEVAGYIVVMGVAGTVNTTEIGIFFVENGDTQTRIEISSLSTNAKRKVAKALFHGLDVLYGLAPPDPIINSLDNSTPSEEKPNP